MKGKKLYLILSSFSKKEVQQFTDFVQSPFFNKNNHLVLFMAYLNQIYPDYKEEMFELEHLPADLFPEEGLSEKKVGYLITGLFQLIEQFLAHHRLIQRKMTHEYYVVSALIDRNIREVYFSRLQKLRKKLNDPDEYGKEQFTLKFMVADLEADLTTAKLSEREKLLQDAIDALISFYRINAFRYSFVVQSHQSIQFLSTPRIPLIEKLEELMEGKEDLDPLSALYYQLHKSVKEATEEDREFSILLELLSAYENVIAPHQLKTIYLGAINLSLRKARLNAKKHTSTTLDLYIKGIDNGALVENGKLTQWTFYNMAKLALRANQLDWAENFINNYGQMVYAIDRKNAVALNKAELAFAKKEYQKALSYLNKVQTTAIRYHTMENILRIKCLWEIREIKPALSALSAFKVYLSRTRGIAPPLKKSCQNFCQILHRISVKGTVAKQRETKEKIVSTKLLAEKPWLLDTFLKENQGMAF